jgi:predicted phosphodiesterase
MDAGGADTISAMTKDLPNVDMYMHLGDFAYDIYDDNGQKGDDFWDLQAASIGNKPYIVTPGNHEGIDKTKFMNYRFRMPGSNDDYTTRNNNYSFITKNVFWITLNPDYYINFYTDSTDPHPLRNALLSWLDASMSAAASSKSIKYKIFFAHRPILCAEPAIVSDCSFYFYLQKPIEDLLRKHKFDLALFGHIHDYGRLTKLYDFTILGPSKVNKSIYLAPVYIISGHSGTDHYFPSENDKKTSTLINEKYITGKDGNY